MTDEDECIRRGDAVNTSAHERITVSRGGEDVGNTRNRAFILLFVPVM